MFHYHSGEQNVDVIHLHKRQKSNSYTFDNKLEMVGNDSFEISVFAKFKLTKTKVDIFFNSPHRNV